MKSSTAQKTSQPANAAAAPSQPSRSRLYVGLVVILLVVAAGTTYVLWARPVEGKFGRDVHIGTLDVSGLTIEQATQAVQARLDSIERQGWSFSFQGETVVILPTVRLTDDPDIAYALADFDVTATIKRAYAASQHWRLPWLDNSVIVPAALTISEDKVISVLAANLKNVEAPAVEPGFSFGGEGKIEVVLPQAGQRLDRVPLFKNLRSALQRLDPPVIKIAVSDEVPTTTAMDAATLLPLVESLDEALPFTLMHSDDHWELTAEVLFPYLSVVRSDGQLNLALKNSFSETFLTELEAKVNRPAQAPRFTLADGRAALWQPPLDGRRLDKAVTVERIIKVLNSPSDESIELAVAVDPAPPLDGEGADLGIKELVGVGRSNFKGSPKNRRFNIRKGADSLNGIIIKPNEEFSLIKALGVIDATTGYLPELVIKGSRTVPEFGGGLCQIGTTTFRTALAAGLPVIERRNHSFRVRYYEPAGTDATIYDPKPDFRFLNDTGRALLLQTKIEGDDLIFELWGTKDGRVAVQTKPRIYNITAPPAKKVIETLDLKPGEEKCTEKPVAGADTEFTYTVTYFDGTIKQEVFKSHYRPWQEVCLLGVTALSTPPPAEGEAGEKPAADEQISAGSNLSGIDAPNAAASAVPPTP